MNNVYVCNVKPVCNKYVCVESDDAYVIGLDSETVTLRLGGSEVRVDRSHFPKDIQLGEILKVTTYLERK